MRGALTQSDAVCVSSVPYVNSTCKVQSLLHGTLTKEREISSRKPFARGCEPLSGMAHGLPFRRLRVITV